MGASTRRVAPRASFDFLRGGFAAGLAATGFGLALRANFLGFPLLGEKVLKNGFGVDTDEFLSQNPVEDVDVGGMDAKAVVHHREMMDALG